MDFMQILSVLLGGGGLITSVLAIYTARAKKIAMEVETLQGVIKTMQEDRNREEQRHNERDKEYQKEIASLKSDVKLLAQRDMLQREVIISARGCPLPSDTQKCPVLVTYREKCLNNDGVCLIK